jgi:uncharacterized BrkB/YihY/UPF0761 family membrane protein
VKFVSHTQVNIGCVIVSVALYPIFNQALPTMAQQKLIKMKHKSSSLSAAIALFALLVIAPLSFAESNAISTMAKILTELNHYPSTENKARLAAISKDEVNSEATRAIAQAIHNVEHQAKRMIWLL